MHWQSVVIIVTVKTSISTLSVVHEMGFNCVFYLDHFSLSLYLPACVYVLVHEFTAYNFLITPLDHTLCGQIFFYACQRFTAGIWLHIKYVFRFGYFYMSRDGNEIFLSPVVVVNFDYSNVFIYSHQVYGYMDCIRHGAWSFNAFYGSLISSIEHSHFCLVYRSLRYCFGMWFSSSYSNFESTN